MKKKIVSVFGDHHNAVLPIGFMLRDLAAHGVTVLIAAAGGKPTAIVMIVRFPHRVVTPARFAHLRGKRHCTIPVTSATTAGAASVTSGSSLYPTGNEPISIAGRMINACRSRQLQAFIHAGPSIPSGLPATGIHSPDCTIILPYSGYMRGYISGNVQCIDVIFVLSLFSLLLFPDSRKRNCPVSYQAIPGRSGRV